MAYVTKAEYDAYGDVAVSETDFPRYAELADLLIDALTMNRIEQWGGLAALPAFVQDKVKKACCAQIQTMAYCGDTTDIVEDAAGGTLSSESLGKYSYSRGQDTNGGDRVNGIELSPMVRVFLAPTGLLFRGINRAYNPYS